MHPQNLLFAFLVAFMAVAARVAGGGVFKHPAGTGEAAFALPVAVAFGYMHESVLMGAFCFAWVFLWFQTGHAVAFKMGADPSLAQSGRKAFLSFFIDPLCKAKGKPLGGAFYCWAFMGLKGFLMHLPLGLWAPVGAILWPTAYYIGNRIVPRFAEHTDGEMVAEFLSGAFSGLVLAAYLVT